MDRSTANGDKRAYHTLDALRGVAALAVVVLHADIMDGSAPRLMPSAYLAVDLFFVLSGFVLEFAYGPRFSAGLSTRRFMAMRYVRLYPLFACGLAIGLVSAAAALVLGAGELRAGGLVVAAVTGVLLLPSPTWAQSGTVFPVNVPGWSLFFELAINAVFAASYRRLSNRVLIAVIAVSAIGLALATAQAGTADMGSSWAHFAGGLPRVSFSFFVGVLLCRTQRAPAGSSALAWVPPVLLIPVFVMAPSPAVRPIVDLAVIGGLFPWIIAVAARHEPGPRGARLFRWLGLISFPIYAIHYPVLELTRRAVHAVHRDALYVPAMVAACVALVLASWVLAKVDVSVRAWLTRRVLRR